MAERADVSQADLDNTDWDRERHLNVVVLATRQPVAKDAVLETAIGWLKAAFNRDAWNLCGPNLGKRWFLVFEGTSGIAASNAKKANLSLKKEDGTWRELSAEAPNTAEPPSSTTPQTQLYISMDASPKESALAGICRSALHVLRAQYPTKNFEVDKKRWAVKLDEIPLMLAYAPTRRAKAAVEPSWFHQMLSRAPHYQGSLFCPPFWRLKLEGVEWSF